jgi:hypothetical protein
MEAITTGTANNPRNTLNHVLCLARNNPYIKTAKIPHPTRNRRINTVKTKSQLYALAITNPHPLLFINISILKKLAQRHKNP